MVVGLGLNYDERLSRRSFKLDLYELDKRWACTYYDRYPLVFSTVMGMFEGDAEFPERRWITTNSDRSQVVGVETGNHIIHETAYIF
jgi:hypothetical protein